MKLSLEIRQEIIRKCCSLCKWQSPKDFYRDYLETITYFTIIRQEQKLTRESFYKRLQWLYGEMCALSSFLNGTPERFSKIKPEMPNQKGKKTKDYDAIAKDQNGNEVFIELIFQRDGKQDFYEIKILDKEGVLVQEINVDIILDICVNNFKNALEKKSIFNKYQDNTILVVCLKSKGSFLHKNEPDKFWDKLIEESQKIVDQNSTCKKIFKEIFLVTPANNGQSECLWNNRNNFEIMTKGA